AGSGNFKSSGIVIPTILNTFKHATLIINDPEHELRIKCAAPINNAGVPVLTFNWGNPALSQGFNPLKRIKSIPAANKLSKLLIRNPMGDGSKDPFFNLTAEGITSFGIRYVLGYMPSEQHTLHHVYHFISAMLYASDEVDVKIAATHDPVLINEYK